MLARNDHKIRLSIQNECCLCVMVWELVSGPQKKACYILQSFNVVEPWHMNLENWRHGEADCFLHHSDTQSSNKFSSIDNIVPEVDCVTFLSLKHLWASQSGWMCEVIWNQKQTCAVFKTSVQSCHLKI